MGSPSPVAWVKYYPRQALVSLLGLSPQAELAHRRLCDLFWSEAEWAHLDNSGIQRLARVSRRAWPGVLRELRLLGWRPRAGRLCNTAVCEVRQEAVRFRAEAVKRGRLGGRPPRRPSPPKPRKPKSNPSLSPAKPRPDPVHGKRTLQDSTVPSTGQAVNAERLPRSGSPQRKSKGDAEARFLKELQEQFARSAPSVAQAELENWGGWWRNRFRENPDKARRVLADIGSMIREGTIHDSPGRAAVDLWKRLP